MKNVLFLMLLISVSTAFANKKCDNMIDSSNHTLKMAELSTETTNEFKVYTRDLYLEVEREDRNSDYFATMKKNLCDAVTSTKGHWNDAHKELASYASQLETMINYKGCRKKKEALKSLLVKLNKDVAASKVTLSKFVEFYNYNLDQDLNCKL